MSLDFNIRNNSFFRSVYICALEEELKLAKKQSRQSGAKRMLRGLLEMRFGRLPKWARRQLKTADYNMLIEWAVVSLDFNRLKVKEVLPKKKSRSKH